MSEVAELLRPRSVQEAVAMLAEHGERARVLAGGTTVMLGRSQRQEVLVDLSAAGLGAIDRGPDGWRVGAMVTCAGLARALGGMPCAVSDAAAAVGSRVLRNHVTVGGNSVMVYAWSDLPVALLCAGAGFVVAGPAGATRTLSADEFFARHPTRLLGRGELLVAVELPPPAQAVGSAFVKLSRNAGDHASASAAARVEMDGPVVRAARLVAGGVKGMPQVLARAATVLAGQEPTAGTLAEAGRAAAAEVEAMSDLRGSAEWRRHVVGVLVQDAVVAAVRRAGGAR